MTLVTQKCVEVQGDDAGPAEEPPSDSPRHSFVDGCLHGDTANLSRGMAPDEGGTAVNSGAGALIARPHMQLATGKGALGRGYVGTKPQKPSEVGKGGARREGREGRGVDVAFT